MSQEAHSISPPDIQPKDAAPRGRPWRGAVALGVIVVLFSVVMWRRHAIRAHWWAWKVADIVQADGPAGEADLKLLSYYLACLVSVGDDGAGAIGRLVHHDCAEARSLAVAATAGLSSSRAVDTLRPLLSDPDRDVREAAATTVAFREGVDAFAILEPVARSGPPDVAATALAALERVDDPRVSNALRESAVDPRSPLVRAQALELVAARMRTAERIEPSGAVGALPVEFELLVDALADTELFRQWLCLEREVARARAFAEGLPATLEPEAPPRSVAEVAAKGLSDLLGEPVAAEPPSSTAARQALLARCAERWAGRRNQTEND